ncbi:MAG: hypothetical protein KY468_15135 [Armatimonadetes bacterium]|nr:hypothetical protein [Armatimonadota bacterium]
MTLTIDVPAGIIDSLRLKAERKGIPFEEYVLGVLEKEVGLAGTQGGDLWRNLTKEEWLKAFHQWADSHDADTPILSNEALRRENMYEDREL